MYTERDFTAWSRWPRAALTGLPPHADFLDAGILEAERRLVAMRRWLNESGPCDDAELDRRLDAFDALATVIAERRAHTPAGVAAKLRLIAAQVFSDDNDETALESAINSLETMGGAA